MMDDFLARDIYTYLPMETSLHGCLLWSMAGVCVDADVDALPAAFMPIGMFRVA